MPAIKQQAQMLIGPNTYDLRILDISDSWEQSLIKYDIVNADGAILQTMGTKAREIKFKTHWFDQSLGENIRTASTYLRHQDFIADCLSNKPSEIRGGESRSDEFNINTWNANDEVGITFIHPKYGKIIGVVSSLTVVNDDTQNYATVDVTFVESGLKTAGPITDTNTLSLMKDYQRALLTTQLSKLSTSIRTAGFGSILGKVIDAAQPLSLQFKNISQATKSFLNQCDTFLGTADVIFAGIAEPANLINTGVNFVNDVPSRLIGSMSSSANRLVGSFGNLVNTPVTFVNNFQVAWKGLVRAVTGKNANILQPRFASVLCGSMTTYAADILTTDENNRGTIGVLERGPTFDIKGNRLSAPESLPVMTSNDLEAFLYTIRDSNETIIKGDTTLGIVGDRDNQSLSMMSNALSIYVNTVKLNRLQQKTMEVSNIPVHLLCMNLGLSYQAAGRILGINPTVTNPTFMNGSVKVYVK